MIMKPKLFSIAAACLLLAGASCGDGFPQAAKDFVKQYYPDLAMTSCETDDDGDCDIHVKGDVEIELDAQGEWKTVKDPGGVPAGIVPDAIMTYVKENYMGRTIVGIDREPQGYEVELFGDIEMKFDRQGNFLELEYDKIVIN